jgi:hypothetical protein
VREREHESKKRGGRGRGQWDRERERGRERGIPVRLWGPAHLRLKSPQDCEEIVEAVANSGGYCGATQAPPQFLWYMILGQWATNTPWIGIDSHKDKPGFWVPHPGSKLLVDLGLSVQDPEARIVFARCLFLFGLICACSHLVFISTCSCYFGVCLCQCTFVCCFSACGKKQGGLG